LKNIRTQLKTLLLDKIKLLAVIDIFLLLLVIEKLLKLKQFLKQKLSTLEKVQSKILFGKIGLKKKQRWLLSEEAVK
jgi:hypothetical protein